MNSPPSVLTQERVAEINERINQWDWGIFFQSLVGDKSSRTSHVPYPSIDDRFSALQASLQNLSKASDIRYVVAVRGNDDPKSHGGFNPIIEKKQARVKRLEPPFIDTNVAIWGIDVDSLKILFFPDTLLILRRKQYQAVPYDSLSVDFSTITSLDFFTPRDAEIVGYTWTHTNVNGGPDRRYSKNWQVPITLYALVSIDSSSGLCIQLLITDKAKAAAFVGDFQNFLHLADTHEESTTSSRHKGSKHKNDNDRKSSGEQRRPPRTSRQSSEQSAWEVLGIESNASKDDIVAAYRKMAQMYHPDKVADLGPELQELADRRMKEINAAYAALMRI